MKKELLIASTLAVIPAFSQEAPPPDANRDAPPPREQHHRHGSGNGMDRRPRMNPELMGMLIVARELLMEKYDADKDGKLSESERETIKKDMDAQRAKFIEKHDTDKDGKLSREEIMVVREAWKKANPGLDGKIKELMKGMGPGPGAHGRSVNPMHPGPQMPPKPASPDESEKDAPSGPDAGVDTPKPPQGEKGPRRGPGPGMSGPLRMLGAHGPYADKVVMAAMQLVIEKYDKDGDGILSKEEADVFAADARKAMEKRREEMQKRREEMIKKYDKDGDGKLSREERRAMMEDMRRKRQEKSPM